MVDMVGSNLARAQHSELSMLAQLSEDSKKERGARLRHDQRIIRQARREMAKQDLLAKVREQQQEILQLRDTVQQWECWCYGCCGIDETYERLRVIAPVITEKVDAASCGRSPKIPGDMRMRRNFAEHVFGNGVSVARANRRDLNRLHRAGQGKPVDVWCLLEGMACAPWPVRSAGGVLITSQSCTIDDEVPDSLLNQMIDSRLACSLNVQRLIEECRDNSWQLQRGDIVYVGSDIHPSIVLRNGYGQYEREVRVAGIQENLTDWRVGHWVKTDGCYKLEDGEVLKATAIIVDATERKNEIPAGTCCRYIGRDDDGDVVLNVGTLGAERVIFKEDLFRLTRQ